MTTNAVSPGQRVLGLVGPLAAAVAAGWWRWDGPLPELVSGAALCLALVIGLAAPTAARWGLFAYGLVLAAVAPLAELGALWPCPAACAGGAPYAHLGGVSIAYLATAAGLWWAAILRVDQVRGDPHHPVGRLARITVWAGAGIALFHLAVAAQLGMRCPYCLAVQTTVLAGACASVRDGAGWAWRGAVAVLAFLLLHYVHHPEVHRDTVATVAAPAVDPAVLAQTDRILANRSRATGVGPVWSAEIVIDLHCLSCARVHPRILRLAPPSGAALAVTTRVLARPSRTGSVELARQAAAAAAIDARSFQLFLAVTLGSAEGMGWDDLRDRVGEVMDLRVLAEHARSHAAAIDRMLALDAAFAEGGTPQVVLRRPDGSEAGRWHGEIDPAVVQAVLATSP
jgi:hypothetical protein